MGTTDPFSVDFWASALSLQTSWGASAAVCAERVGPIDSSVLPGVGERGQSAFFGVYLGLLCPFLRLFLNIQSPSPFQAPGSGGGQDLVLQAFLWWGEPPAFAALSKDLTEPQGLGTGW